MTTAPWTDGSTVDITIGGTVHRMLRGSYPVPTVYSGDTSQGATNLRASLANQTPAPFIVGVDVPFTAEQVERFKPAVAGVPSAGPVDCTVGKGVPPQDWGALESPSSNTNGRPTFGPDVGLANWHALGRHEGEDDHNMLIFMRDEYLVNAPVFIYYPGGGGDVGASQSPLYYAARMALEGIIVIIANYRRGYLGHQYHPDYAIEDGYQGPNLALSDQRAVIDWVIANGVDIGADINRITVGGGSFGAASVLALLADPDVDGKVKNALVISGAGGGERRAFGDSTTGSRMGYGRLCSEQQGRLTDISPFDASPDVNYSTVADAISGTSLSAAMRNSVYWDFFVRDHDGRNVFLWRDNIHVNHKNAVTAAEDDAMDSNVNVVIATTVNEFSVVTSGELNRDAYARLLGYRDFAEISAKQYWQDMLTEYDEEPDLEYLQNMVLYTVAMYWAPAVRLAEKLGQSQPYCALAMDNYISQGNGQRYTNHTSLPAYVMGYPLMEWKVGMDGDEARIYARDVFYSEGWLRAVKNLCFNGSLDPVNGLAYKMFGNDPEFNFTASEVGDHAWNICGSSNLVGSNAAAQVQYLPNGLGDWFADMLAEMSERI